LRRRILSPLRLPISPPRQDPHYHRFAIAGQQFPGASERLKWAAAAFQRIISLLDATEPRQSRGRHDEE